MSKDTGRIFKGRQDLLKMAALIRQNRSELHQYDYPSPLDLEEMLTDPQVVANTRVWDPPTGEMAAFALVDGFYNLCWEIQPGKASDELEREIQAWAEQSARRMAGQNHEKARLESGCREEDAPRISFLTRSGFQMQPEKNFIFILDLQSNPLPEVEVPDGFSIRPANGEAEAEALAEVHRRAFDSKVMTRERRLAAMRGGDYRPELDLVMVAPDQQLVGICSGVIHPDEIAATGVKIGSVESLAVLPKYRRKGLAKALLATCTIGLQQAGMKAARCAFSGENQAMLGVAPAAGLRQESTLVWFKKELI